MLRVQHFMNVNLYECECLLDLSKLKLVLYVLLVNCSSKYQHCHCASKDHKYVKNCVNIGYQGQLHIDELEIIKQQDNRVKEVSAHECRTVDEDTVHIFPTQVHEAEANEEPGLQILRASEVDSGKYSIHWL